MAATPKIFLLSLAGSVAVLAGGVAVYETTRADATELPPLDCPGGSVDGRCTTVFIYKGQRIGLQQVNELRAHGRASGMLVGKEATWVVDSEDEMAEAAKEAGVKWTPPRRP